jgi:hypothetical protein
MSNQIVSFNDSITQTVFMERIKQLANDMAKEMGVDINMVGNISTNENIINFKIGFKVKGTTENINKSKVGPIEQSEIKVGFKFIIKGTLYEVKDFKWRNYKKPVLLNRLSDGKGFKASFDTICKGGKRYDR